MNKGLGKKKCTTTLDYKLFIKVYEHGAEVFFKGQKDKKLTLLNGFAGQVATSLRHFASPKIDFVRSIDAKGLINNIIALFDKEDYWHKHHTSTRIKAIELINKECGIDG